MTNKDKAKNTRLLREYQISLEERNLVAKYQNYCCAICKKPEKNMKIALSVDHEHREPGRVKGLLCLRCNKALSLLNDDPVICEAAAFYLRNFPFTVVFGHEKFTAIGKVGTKARRKRLAQLRKNNEEKKKQK